MNNLSRPDSHAAAHRRLFRSFSLTMLGLYALSACSTAGIAGRVAGEVALAALGIPREAVDPKPQPIEATLNLEAGRNLNGDEQGRSYSVVLRIYELRATSAFEAAPFASFGVAERERDSFGGDVVTQREYVLSPGQKLTLKDKINPDSAGVGVVALFHSPYPRRWRFVFARESFEQGPVSVGVHECALTSPQTPPQGRNLQEVAGLSAVRCAHRT